ncbi:MAG: DUF4358 domain-containing protein [Oscillospiraceae bacterium]|nr:DUF4358 domain-containing protein [Oscillospiraceae bacterium]
MKKWILTAAAVLLCSCSVQADSTSGTPSETILKTQETTAAQTTEAAAEAETEAAPAEETEAPAAVTVAEIVSYTCDDVCQRIMSEMEFPSMVKVDADSLSMYIDTAVPEGTDWAMYICGSGGFADELFIMKDAPDDTVTAAKARVDRRHSDFEDYAPDEALKLEDALFIEENGYFMYFVTYDNDKCDDIAHEMLRS